MEYHHLTATGLVVSKLCLGTMTFRAQVSQEDSVCMTHMALDRGTNSIDTANVYQDGLSETILGKALKRRRQDMIMLRKFVSAGTRKS